MMLRSAGWAAKLVGTVGLSFLLVSCGNSGPPYNPKDAIRTIKIEEGFRVDPFLSEPTIKDPVAMDWDEEGRIYVAEDTGYPLDTRPTGQIALLRDTNGDGIPDRRTVFADHLVMPNGVMRWGKGILVTAAPDVWYFEDSKGDGKADIRRKVLTGFAFTNPQHMVNDPLYGPDNWIYLAHQGFATAVVFKDLFGDRGGDIRFADRETPSLKAGRFDVRFRPETHQLEAVAGWSQYGQAFDEWGRQFTITNDSNGRHVVLAAQYLRRNPDLLVSSAMQDVSTPDNNRVFPITENPRMEILTDVGTLTSSCSITLPYMSGIFPASFHRVACLAEPAHGMVHCDLWSDAGASYTAKRLQEGAEFLASTDSWFRPVNMYIGPDGALYLIDYYRKFIEHPEWMAANTYHAKDLYAGNDRGRIYRIVPASRSPLPLPRNIHLGAASDQELVQQLGNPNIWWRRTAQRLLVERRHQSALGLLSQFFQTTPSPLGRLHALWTLDGLGKLDDNSIAKALEDPEPGVRENAIRLAESRLGGSPPLVRKLLTMADDSDVKVRFQLLCTLGFVNSAQVQLAENKLLARDIEDPWVQLAALSGASDRAPQYFQMAVTQLSQTQTAGRASFFQKTCAVIGMRQKRQEVRRVLDLVASERGAASEWWRAPSLGGLAQGCRARGAVAAKTLRGTQSLLARLFESSPPAVRHASLELLAVAGLSGFPSLAGTLKREATTASDRKADPGARADAVGLLALANPQTHEALLRRLIDPAEPDEVQIAAIRALAPLQDTEVADALLPKWKAMSPDVMNEATEALLRAPGRVRLLLDAVEKGGVEPWMLNPFKPALFMERDSALREKARTLLLEESAQTQKVLQQYQTVLQMKGDWSRGKEVFTKNCSKCHQLAGVGVAVGPNLGTVRNHPASELLVDILVPSRSIEQGYETYVVEKTSGGLVDGVMSSHTPATITLRQEHGREVVIPREDIKRMYASQLSMMPEGLYKQISVRQMADLLAFVRGMH